MSISDVRSWYTSNSPKYNDLEDKATIIIKEILRAENIQYQIESRVKELDRLEEKILRKGYNSINQVQDLLGLRIICYVYSDIRRISDLIQDNFIVHEAEDKSEKLGIDKVGYQSLHFIVSLSKHRTNLPEYARFKGMEFEIQVRTILQHTWAEIEHDRNYKFRGKLPKNLQRRFKLVAGALEMCEREFEAISEEIKKYSQEISFQIKQGKLDIPINSYSLRLYLIDKFGDIPSFKAQYGLLWVPETLDQLEWLDIKTLQDFDKIIPPEFKKKYMKIQPPKHGIDLSRLINHILIIYRTEDYFNRAWQNRYYEFDSQDHLVFEEFNVNMNNFPEEIHFDCSNL